jgi:predicted amidohydrolase YtcJ
MWIMITRTDGETLQTFGEAERVSRDEALKILTTHGSYLLQMEDRIGSLETGKYADLAVLSDDYLTVPETEIKDLASVLTMVGGKIVHDPTGLAG